MEREPSDASPSVCPRHPERVSHLLCGRCGRPACPECQHPTPTGFDCVDCVPTAAEGRSAAHEVAPREASPMVTYVLMGVCVVVYLLQRLMPEVTEAGDFSPVTGAMEPWRFITSAFLHSPETLSHLLFNMMSLYWMGRFLEPFLGRGRYLALYLLSALGGSVGCLLFIPHLDLSDQVSRTAWFQSMVGASGAVFGLFTAAFVVLRRTGAPVGGMLVLIAINLALPFFYPNIAWQAHVGGALVGLLTATALFATARPDRVRFTWPVIAALAALLVGAAGLKYGANVDELGPAFRFLELSRQLAPAGDL